MFPRAVKVWAVHLAIPQSCREPTGTPAERQISWFRADFMVPSKASSGLCPIFCLHSVSQGSESLIPWRLFPRHPSISLSQGILKCFLRSSSLPDISSLSKIYFTAARVENKKDAYFKGLWFEGQLFNSILLSFSPSLHFSVNIKMFLDTPACFNPSKGKGSFLLTDLHAKFWRSPLQHNVKSSLGFGGVFF